jgi:hypothetical protein
VGNPDLSAADGGSREPSETRRGFVVFPVESLALRGRDGAASRLRDWGIVIAALVVAALVIAVALLAH